MVIEQCQKRTLRRSDYRFSRRDIREYTQWGNTQLKVHLKRLEDLEYLLVHRGGRGQSFVYECLYDGNAKDKPHLNGLIDIHRLKDCLYDEKKSGSNGKRSGSSRPPVGPKSGGGRPDENTENPIDDNQLDAFDAEPAKNTYIKGNGNGSSYVQPLVAISK